VWCIRKQTFCHRAHRDDSKLINSKIIIKKYAKEPQKELPDKIYKLDKNQKKLLHFQNENFPEKVCFVLSKIVEIPNNLIKTKTFPKKVCLVF
jgi:hypothetical protein